MIFTPSFLGIRTVLTVLVSNTQRFEQEDALVDGIRTSCNRNTNELKSPQVDLITSLSLSVNWQTVAVSFRANGILARKQTTRQLGQPPRATQSTSERLSETYLMAT